MKHVTAALICLGILYAVDALLFNGTYFAVAEQAVARAWALDW